MSIHHVKSISVFTKEYTSVVNPEWSIVSELVSNAKWGETPGVFLYRNPHPKKDDTPDMEILACTKIWMIEGKPDASSEEFLLLTDPDAPDQDETSYADGITLVANPRYGCSKIEVVQEIVRYFFITGELHPEYVWEVPPWEKNNKTIIGNDL